MSPAPLSSCLAWMAYTADIRYILQSSLGLPFGTMKKKMDDWLDILDTEINRLARMEEEMYLNPAALMNADISARPPSSSMNNWSSQGL